MSSTYVCVCALAVFGPPNFHGGFTHNTYTKSPAIDFRQVLIPRLQTGAQPPPRGGLRRRRIIEQGR